MKIDFATLYTASRDDDPRSPLARAFSWLTRSGVGRKFGSLPIGWYQIHQCHGLDVIEERTQKVFGATVTAFELRATRNWGIEARPANIARAKWQRIGWPVEMFAETDRRARK